jgi:hypothetical protein
MMATGGSVQAIQLLQNQAIRARRVYMLPQPWHHVGHKNLGAVHHTHTLQQALSGPGLEQLAIVGSS